MEIERLNYLIERAQGNEIYGNNPESVNLAELVRRTAAGTESSDWEVVAQTKIGDFINILKRFRYDDEGGKVSVIINNKGTLSESQYSFKDAFKWHGEGYLEVEKMDPYKPYVSSVGMIRRDEQGNLDLKGNFGLMHEYKALFELLHPRSTVVVPKIPESSIVSVSTQEIKTEPELDVEVSEAVPEALESQVEAFEIVEETVPVEEESEESGADLEMITKEAQAEVNEYKRRLDILEQGGRLAEDEAYDADRHTAAEARLLSYQNAAVILAASVLHEASEEESAVEQIIQAPVQDQPRVNIENSEITELKRQLREADKKIVLLENEINYLSHDNAKSTKQLEDIGYRMLEVEIEYAPPAVDKTEVEAQTDKPAEVETPSLETNQKEADIEGEKILFNGAVKGDDGKFVSPKDQLTKSEREPKVGVAEDKDKEAEASVGLKIYDLDSGMRIGFPRMLRNKEDVLARANNQINLFDPLRHDLGWLEDEIRKMVKSLRPSYTRDMLTQVKLIPPESREEE